MKAKETFVFNKEQDHYFIEKECLKPKQSPLPSHVQEETGLCPVLNDRFSDDDRKSIAQIHARHIQSHIQNETCLPAFITLNVGIEKGIQKIERACVNYTHLTSGERVCVQTTFSPHAFFSPKANENQRTLRLNGNIFSAS